MRNFSLVEVVFIVLMKPVIMDNSNDEGKSSLIHWQTCQLYIDMLEPIRNGFPWLQILSPSVNA